MTKQVDKKHYNFEKYCGPDRWGSYHYQIKEVLGQKPSTVLEVGSGDGVLRSYVEKTGVEYKNLDIAEDLNPDILGSVEKIPLPDSSFDVVCAFEVLEHLPFKKFEEALKEMSRVSKGCVLLSLPHYGPMIKFSFKIPFFKEKRFAFKTPHHPEHKFNGEHYWEIGKKGHEIQKIRNVLSKIFVIKKEYIPFENSYHHFFVLENIYLVKKT